MGRPKAALSWDDETFVARELRALHDTGLRPLLCVCGVHIAETRAALPAGIEVEVHENPHPERGQLSSLKLALTALERRQDLHAALVALVDHPAVRLDTLSRLRDAAAPDRIVVPRRGDRRGHPVVFGRSLFAELLATPDPAGARRVVRRDASRVVELETDDPGVLIDVDTPEDLARLRDLPGTTIGR